VACSSGSNDSDKQDTVSKFNITAFIQEHAVGGNGQDRALAVIETADSGRVAVGYLFNGSNDDAAIWKFTADGVLDRAFGNGASGGGIYIQDNIAGGNGDDKAVAVASSNDSGWIVVGWSNSVSGQDIVLWKFTQFGKLDAKFGNGTGIVVLSPSELGNEAAIDVVATADGGWLVAGDYACSASSLCMALWKFDSSGNLDVNFAGGQGVFIFNDPDASHLESFSNGLAVTQDGAIILVGSTLSSSAINNELATVLKLTAKGELDTTFGGGDGIFVHENPLGTKQFDSAMDVAATSDGGWLVAGYTSNAYSLDLTLLKFTAENILDSKFAEGSGIFIYSQSNDGLGFEWPNDIVSNANGGWTVVGAAFYAASPSTGSWNMAMWNIK